MDILWDAHVVAVRGLVRRTLLAVADVDDVVQGVFVTAWRRSTGLVDDPGSPGARAWLLAVATGHVQNANRAEQRRRAALRRFVAEVSVRDPGVTATPEVAVPETVGDPLSTLRAADQTLLRLWSSGMSTAELAVELSVSEAAVRQRLSRARKQLATALLAATKGGDGS